MRAAVLHGPRALRVEGVPAPVPGPREVLVRVAAAGLCGTDEQLWAGERPVSYPLIPGHEFVGRVTGVGAGVRRVAVGERVAIEPNWGCGQCDLCRDGRGNLCLGRITAGIDRAGGFAELAVLPEQACWPAPAEVPDQRLVFAEPLAVVVRAVGRAAPEPGQAAAVVGAGSLGLLGLQLLRARGCRVLVVARSAERLELARRLGADATVAIGSGGPASAPAVVAAARALAGRDGVDGVLEPAGSAQAVELVLGAVGFVRPGGRVVLTGLPHEESRVPFFWLVRRELEVLGSMIYRGEEFPRAIDLLARGAVAVEPLLTHRFALDGIEAALAAHRRPEAIKVVVFPAGVPA